MLKNLAVFSPAFLSAFLSLSAFAQSPCIQDICYGDIVIDSSNYTGTVVGIDQQTNRVIYRRDGYGSTSTASASSLAEKVDRYGKLERGKVIIDNSNYVGVVQSVYDDGRVHYRRNGYSSNSLKRAHELTLRVDQYEKLKKGLRIIDNSNYTGVVSAVYEDGRTHYRRDGYSSDSLKRAHELTLKVETYDKLKVRDRIIDSSNYTGMVTALYADGRVHYRKDGYSSDSLKKANQLVLQVKNYEDLTEGMTVIDSSNYIGQIRKLYADGRIHYRKRGYSSDSLKSHSQLSKKVDRLKKLERNVLVIDSSNYIGTVNEIFENGKVAYRKKGYSSDSIKDVNQLSPEVETHDKYIKGELYATNNHKVAQAKTFFQNGKIEMTENAGIQNVLYSQVDTLDTLVAGDRVSTGLGVEGTINTLFANNTIQYTIEGGDLATGALLNTTEVDIYEAGQYVNGLSQYFYLVERLGEDEAEMLKRQSGLNHVVEHKSLNAYNYAVGKLLEEERLRPFMYDRDTLKKVQDYLLDQAPSDVDATDSDSDAQPATPENGLKVYVNKADYTEQVRESLKEIGLESAITETASEATLVVKVKKKFLGCKATVSYVSEGLSTEVTKSRLDSCSDVLSSALSEVLPYIRQ